MGNCFRSLLVVLIAASSSFAQVDTTFIYNNNMPYGSLDIRLAKSASDYYYLQEDKTFSFRQNDGTTTNTYLDMTSWDSSPYRQGNLREVTPDGDQFMMNYRFLIPDNYNATYSPGYPLLVIFHGLGERGNCWDQDCYHADQLWSPITNTPPAPTDATSMLLNNDHQLTNAGNYHLKAHNDAKGKLPNDQSLVATAWPGFIIFPQNLNGWSVTTSQDVIRLVRLFCKKYNIDENRIYIHGLSNGGQGVFETIKRAPWMFAAALAMSPIGDGFINQQGMAPAIAHIPMWVFQGGLDKNPYPQKTESMIRKFREAGASVRYTLYPDLGHGTWSTAYREPDFFPWILGKNNTTIHVHDDNPTICGGTGVQLDLPPGFFAYQWQFNGQTIGSATTATYNATAAGKYRARFSRIQNPTEAQWQPWSNEVEVKAGQALPQAEIIQHGTVVLKDPNGGNVAVLEAKGEFDKYQWYKNGVLVDFAGDQDDTLKVVNVTTTQGAGAYTLVVSNYSNCSSAASAAKTISFSDQAPLSITAPTNLTGSAAGVEVNLTWKDASANEGGFEIWRRTKLSTGSFGSWEMVAFTPANATSYKDTGLLSTTTYEYRVRGVGPNIRSNYAPSNTTALSITTANDTHAPTAPAKLSATLTGVSRVKLSWPPSTDDSGIKDYMVNFGSDSVATGDPDTVFVLTNAPLNQTLRFTVRARDLSNNRSAASPSVDVNTSMAGLFYEHSTGAFTSLDSVNWNHAEFTGRVLEFTLAPKTQEEYFNFKFDGFVFLEQGGNYQFRTTSDDGSRLTLDGQVLVNNDGIHSLKTVESAAKNLEAGAHRITVFFFENIETDSLAVEYKGTDTNNEWRLIPHGALKSAENVVTAISPDNGPADSFELSVYPNPTTQDNIHVEVQTAVEGVGSIQLLDPIGKRILNHEQQFNAGANQISLAPMGALTPGIYFVIVQQGGAYARQRVVLKQ